MITSTANQQVKQVSQLNKKAKLRNDLDLFVVEGPKMFGEAPTERVEKVYISESCYGKQPDLRARLAQVSYEVVADSVFKSMSDTQTPPGYFVSGEAVSL